MLSKNTKVGDTIYSAVTINIKEIKAVNQYVFKYTVGLTEPEINIRREDGEIFNIDFNDEAFFNTKKEALEYLFDLVDCHRNNLYKAYEKEREEETKLNQGEK